MEPPPSNKIPPDRARDNSLNESSSAMSAAAVSTQPNSNNQLVLYSGERPSASASIVSLTSNVSGSSNNASSTSSGASVTAPIEKLSRPMAFDKMESLVKEMQDTESGVPVRSQKIFLTSIPSAFMGYDLIEWLMERLNVEESEALNMANQLCQHGYFFPVSDSKTLVVKDDSSLYRFQSPYYWPWRQQKAPDQIEYAIYLAKRSLRNKQRHGLEEYETEALASCHKNLKGKWDFILMQAEEQIKLGKDRKKGDKIVSDSQEKAYWRVHRPPPGQFTPLEPCPIPSRGIQGKPRKRNEDDLKREIEITKTSIGRNRMKMSTACESLVAYFETFTEYDPLMQPALPSNPWVTEDITFWQLNSHIVEIPTEKRVRRWAISIEELVNDPTGLNEFTSYLRKEYSHENIRFWAAVNDLRRSSHSQISRKAREIYEEFLEPGAPCEINIDGKTMEKVQQALKTPSRFTFDVAAEHVYTLLLKKDCYPRFIRSEHYKSLLANAIQPSQKKRFFGFGGQAKKKASTTTAPNPSHLSQMTGGTNNSSLTRRRGSDRSLSGSAHELAVCGVKQDPNKVVHSHSQSNLSEIPYRTVIYRGDMPTGRLASGNIQEPTKQLETTFEAPSTACSVCPWDTIDPPTPPSSTPASNAAASATTSSLLPPPSPSSASTASKPILSVDLPTKFTSSSSDIVNTDVSDRMKRSCGLGIRQNTLDSDFHSTKRLAPVINEQRRASMTMAPRISELQNHPTTAPTVTTTRPPDEEFDIPIRVSELSLVIDKADSIEEEKEEQIEDEKVEKSEKLKENEPPSLEASDRERRTSSCHDTMTDKTAVIAATKSEVSSRKTSIVDEMKKKSFESESEPVAETSSDDVDANAQRKHVETQQDKNVAQEIDEKDTKDEPKDIYTPHQHSISQDEDYEMGLVSGLLPGCVAPAPTPAPSIAPLAESELDGNDDEGENFDTKSVESDKKKKRKEKKERDASVDEAAGPSSSTATDPDNKPKQHNAVCPWEDEDVTTTVEAPFVKTYATLGYL